MMFLFDCFSDLKMKEQIGYVPPPYIPLDSSDPEDDTDQVNQEQDHHSFNEDTQDRAQWSSGICACFDDMPSCTLLSDLSTLD